MNSTNKTKVDDSKRATFSEEVKTSLLETLRVRLRAVYMKLLNYSISTQDYATLSQIGLQLDQEFPDDLYLKTYLGRAALQVFLLSTLMY